MSSGKRNIFTPWSYNHQNRNNMIFVIWLGLAVVVGMFGANRKIGFGMAFMWAVLLSPLIGFLITAMSDSLDTVQRQKLSASVLSEKTVEDKLREPMAGHLSAEIERLQKMKNDGLLNEDQFKAAVNKTLA